MLALTSRSSQRGYGGTDQSPVFFQAVFFAEKKNSKKPGKSIPEDRRADTMQNSGEREARINTITISTYEMNCTAGTRALTNAFQIWLSVSSWIYIWNKRRDYYDR